MSASQEEFGGLPVVIAFVALAALSVFAVPKYQSSMDKARLAEAFELASVSKRKLTEFYIVNGRFPNSEREAQAMIGETFPPPEFVHKMTVEHGDERHDILIKVFMKPAQIHKPEGSEQYIFIAGNPAAFDNRLVQWSCGGAGVNADLLPDDCRS